MKWWEDDDRYYEIDFWLKVGMTTLMALAFLTAMLTSFVSAVVAGVVFTLLMASSLACGFVGFWGAHRRFVEADRKYRARYPRH